MKRGRHLGGLSSGFVAVVCLLWGRTLPPELLDFQPVEPRKKSPTPPPARTDHPRKVETTLRAQNVHEIPTVTLRFPRLPAKQVTLPATSKPVEIPTTSAGATPAPPVATNDPVLVTPQAPAITYLPTLGYIQRVNGEVEAFVPEGEVIRLVHEGDAFGHDTHIGKIYSTAVEVVRDPANPAKPAETQIAEAHSDPGTSSATPIDNPIGYVEKTDGQVQAIVAVGNRVHLVKADKTLVARINNAQPSAPAPEAQVAEAQQSEEIPASQPSETTVAEAQTVVPADQNPSPKTSDAQTAVLNEEVLARPNIEHPAPPQPEPKLAPPKEPGAVTPPAAAERSAGVLIGPPESIPKGAKFLGYVESLHGQRQAILWDSETVRLIHEGDVLWNSLRVKKISPNSIEFVKISMQRPPPVSQLRRDVVESPRPTSCLPNGPPQVIGSLETMSGKRNSMEKEGGGEGAPSLRTDEITHQVSSSNTYSCQSREVCNQNVGDLEAFGYVEMLGGERETLAATGVEIPLTGGG